MPNETEYSKTTPIDPTSLTTAALMHEIEVMKETVFRENLSLEKLLGQRLAEMEKAVKVAHDDLVRVPTDVQKQVGALRDLHDETFNRIEQKIKDESIIRDEKFSKVDVQTTNLNEKIKQAKEEAVTGFIVQEKAVTATKLESEKAILLQEKAVTAALAAADRAIVKAEMAVEKRFESVNEFRKTLSEQTNSFIPRIEAMALLKANEDKLNMLGTRLDKMEGTGTGRKDVWGFIIGAVGLLATILAVIGFFVTRG